MPRPSPPCIERMLPMTAAHRAGHGRALGRPGGAVRPNGAYSNCWCTWWTWRAAEWERRPPARAPGRAAVAGAARAGARPPGLRRRGTGRMVRRGAALPRTSASAAPGPGRYRPRRRAESWVVTCFFVRRDRRGGSRVGAARRRRAVRGRARRHARRGLPGRGRDHGTAAMYTGTIGMFREEGFVGGGPVRGPAARAAGAAQDAVVGAAPAAQPIAVRRAGARSTGAAAPPHAQNVARPLRTGRRR